MFKFIVLDRRSVKSGIGKRERILKGEEDSWFVIERKIRRDVVIEDIKEIVNDYWKLMVSRLIGNKKDLVRKRVVVKMWVEYFKYVFEKI